MGILCDFDFDDDDDDDDLLRDGNNENAAGGSERSARTRAAVVFSRLVALGDEGCLRAEYFITGT